MHATFEGEDGTACTREDAGACWPFVGAWFGQFMYGRYPDAERWRVNLTYALAVAGLVPLMVPRIPGKLWHRIYVLAVFPVLAFILLSGGVLGLPFVPTDLWGGLLVTLVISSVGIAAAIPNRHHPGAGPPLAHADRALGICRLHRVRARRAADHGAVHVFGDAAAVSPRAVDHRQARARAYHGGAVLRRLPG